MSNLNIADSSIVLFSIDKPTIIFQIDPNIKNLTENNINASISSHNAIKLGQTSLIVSNLTSEYLSLRTKTTKKHYYLVFPSYCIIKPNSQQKLDFNYFVNEGEKINNSGHKFMFEGFIISPEEKDQEARALFNKYISQKIPVKAYSIKSSVEFKINDNVSSNIKNDVNNNIKNSLNKNNENNNIDNKDNDKDNFNNYNSKDTIKSKNSINDNENNVNMDIKNNIDKIDNNFNINNSINNNIITKEKLEDNNRINIINEENNKIEKNIINLKEKISISEKNSKKNLSKDQINKSLPLDTNNSFNKKEEPKEDNLFSTFNKNRQFLNSTKDFGTPKKKGYMFSSNKRDDFEYPKTEEERNALLNNLKVEYYKLKNELDNLIEKYHNLRNYVDLEEDNRDLNSDESLKNKYSERKKKEIKIPQNICILIFLLSILLGFYLS